jgi:R3H domain
MSAGWFGPCADSCVHYLGRKKDKYIPEEFREQWERDRAKKAERKRLRELERSAAALDLFRTGKGSKRKKARKARLAAASATPMSPETVVELMRQFVADIGGARTYPLPPMERKMRKTVHELAHAFKLNSKSKSSHAARFTTLTKTTLSGMNIDEKAITRILGQPSSYESHEGGKGKGRPRAGRIRPRDGEVVGEVRFFCREQLGAELLIPYSLRLHPSLTVRILASRYYLPWDGKKAAGLDLSEGWKRRWWPSSKQQS